jgi:hypothetical protein
MLRPADIPSERAEKAAYQTVLIEADFRERRAALEPDSLASWDAARDATFQLVTVAEIFASEHLLDIVERQLPEQAMVDRVWGTQTSRIVRDWRSRETSWKDLADVQWNYPNKAELEGFVAARNIIAHGIGRLTLSQLQRGRIRANVLKSLKKADLRLDGYRLALTVADVERCGNCVRGFVAWLDGASKARTS